MASDDTGFDRRKYLKALGATSGIAALAGCGGGGDGDGGTTTTTPDDTTTSDDDGTTTTDDGTTTTTEENLGTPMDDMYTMPLGMEDPTKGQFNQFNGKQPMDQRGWMYDPLVVYDRFNQEYLPRIAESWDIGDESVIININTDYQWVKWQQDGLENAETKPVTAEDVKLDFEMSKHIASDWPGNRAITGWEVKDDSTLELTPREDRWNDLIFTDRALSRSIDVPRMMWAEHAKKLRNMEKGSEEFNSYLKENVLDYRMGPDEVWLNGAYYYDQTLAKREVHYKKNPHYPRADNVEVDTIQLWKTGSGRERTVQAILQDEIDHHANSAISPNVADRFPDHWDRVITGGLGGGATYFDHNARWTGKSDVRQAIVFAVDNEQVVRNVNRTPVGPKIAGINNQSMKTNWLGGLLDDFTDYGGKQFEKASELMRNAGAEKNSDGWWADANGEPIEIDFKAISGWTTAIVMNQTIVSHLRSWGLKAESVGIPTSTFFSEHWTSPDEMKPFDAIKYPVFGSPYVWHPFYYANYFYLPGGAGEKFGGGHKYEVPATIGDPGSAVETIDAPKLAEELGTINDLQRQKEIVERLSWLYNQNAVAFINNKPATHGWHSNDHWDYPTVESSRNPPNIFENFGTYEMLAQNELTPKYEDE